jgi:acyl-CoA synthetase (NDP forming)
MKSGDQTGTKKISLDEVFSPSGIAVVGVSPNKMGFAEMVVHALKSAEFPEIYPINPNYEEVFGLCCYASILDVPDSVDHVIVNIPSGKVLALLDQCAVKGVKSVHFFTAGFRESGYQDKAELEQKMMEKARIGGFRIIGPNCIGMYVPKNRITLHYEMPLEPGPVAFISQSGGHAHNLPIYSAPRGIRFSKVVSYGNALDVDENEMLEYFARDPETEIIAAYIEGVKDGRRFSELLQEAAARKPVVIYKGGRTEAGKRTAFSHTASMMSSVAVFDGLCRQMKAIQVDTTDEMIDVLVALQFANPRPRGKGVAIMGAGGGPSVLAGDELEKEGLSVPLLSQDAQTELKKYLPVDGSIFINPVDTPNLTSPDAIATAMNILGRLPGIDMLVYHLGFHPIGSWGMGLFSSKTFLDQLIGSIHDAVQTNRKPVLLALRPPHDLKGMEEFLIVQKACVEAGLPVFYSLHRMARAMNRILEYSGQAPSHE